MWIILKTKAKNSYNYQAKCMTNAFKNTQLLRRPLKHPEKLIPDFVFSFVIVASFALLFCLHRDCVTSLESAYSCIIGQLLIAILITNYLKHM
jgi:hypothetical protein